MSRVIYVVYDQVSGNFGSVFDFANDAECIRAFKAMVKSGGVPEHYVRDSAIMRIAYMDTDSGSAVVTPVTPVIVYYGSEALCNEEAAY